MFESGPSSCDLEAGEHLGALERAVPRHNARAVFVFCEHFFEIPNSLSSKVCIGQLCMLVRSSIVNNRREATGGLVCGQVQEQKCGKNFLQIVKRVAVFIALLLSEQLALKFAATAGAANTEA